MRWLLRTLEIIRLLLLQVENSSRSTTMAVAQLVQVLGPASGQISTSAFSQARQRMHWSTIRELFRYAVTFHQTRVPQELWKGRRIFAIDGTRLTVPSSFNKQKYIRTAKNAHYLQAMLTVLYQLKAGIPHDAQFCRHFDERRAALHHLKYLDAGDVVVVDRGFFLQNSSKPV